MSVNIRYFASLQSPWTYLGHDRFYDLIARHGATAVCKPVDFGKIFSVSGGLPLGQRAEQRQAYRLADLTRWRDHLGLELNLHPKHFPTSELAAAHMVTAHVQQGGDAGQFASAILRAVWADEKDISDKTVLLELADQSGVNGAALLAKVEQPETVAAHEANTQEAIDLGVFGAPTYDFEGELFWGQDRLDLLDRALSLRSG